jgi:hypothetical protein
MVWLEMVKPGSSRGSKLSYQSSHVSVRIGVCSSVRLTNLFSYASLFGLKFMESFMWHWINNSHSRCRLTACPTLSTATMLMRKGIRNTRIWPRGVDLDMFGPHRRCSMVRQAWGIEYSLTCRVCRTDTTMYPLTPPPSPTPSEADASPPWKERCVILYVGRL